MGGAFIARVFAVGGRRRSFLVFDFDIDDFGETVQGIHFFHGRRDNKIKQKILERKKGINKIKRRKGFHETKSGCQDGRGSERGREGNASKKTFKKV